MIAAIGIAIVVLLIVWLKMHAFLALTIGALFVGIGSGIAAGQGDRVLSRPASAACWAMSAC